MLTDSFNDVKSGIYESLITEVIQDNLSKIETHYNVEKQNLDPADAALYLSRFLQNLLHWLL